MTYKITVTPNAFSQAAKSYRPQSSDNDDLTERLYMLWQDVEEAATSSDIVFEPEDETEAARGGNYAFDDILEAFVSTGKTLTTEHLIKHLRALGCHHPKQVLAIFLQTQAQFHFHIGGSVLNYFIMSLGEGLPPENGIQEEGSAKRANFKIAVAGNGTTLYYEDSFSIIKITKTGSVSIKAGTIHAAITMTNEGQFIFHPVVMNFDESDPDVRELINIIQRNAPIEANQQSMTIDATAIQIRQNMAVPAPITPTIVKNTSPPVKITQQKQDIKKSSTAKIIAGILLVGIGLGLVYTGLIIASFAMISITVATMISPGIIFGAAVCIGLLATLLAGRVIKALIADPVKPQQVVSHKNIQKPMRAISSLVVETDLKVVPPAIKEDKTSVKNPAVSIEKKPCDLKTRSISSFFSDKNKPSNINDVNPSYVFENKSGFGG